MSEKTIKLDIVSAEEELFSAQVQMVFAPAMMGEVGVSPKHTPLMTMPVSYTHLTLPTIYSV